MRATLTLLASVAAAAVLTACGGAGGYDAPPAPVPTPTPASTTEVPASAGASVMALVGYLDTLPAADATEALSLALVTPAASETDEPLAITK